MIQAAEHNEAQYEAAKELYQLRRNGYNIEVLVEWDGLPDQTDYTWEPLQQFHEDVPEMLETFLKKEGQRTLKKSALELVKKK